MLEPKADTARSRLPDDWIEVQVQGRRYVVSGTCPHRKGRMVFGYINTRNHRITCPLHHSTFDLETGRVVSGPSQRPLPVCGPGVPDDAAVPTAAGDPRGGE